MCSHTTVSWPCLAGSRSRSQRKSGSGRRTRAEDSAQGPALRESGGSAGLSGSLGRTLGRYAHSRHHETASGGHVRRGKPSLLALPLEPFRYYQYGERVVHLDGCVEVEAAYYGLPPGWIGRSVKVQWDALHVRILHPGTNQLLREHLRQKRGGYRIKGEDYPKKMSFTTAQLLRRTGHAGKQIGVLSVAIYWYERTTTTHQQGRRPLPKDADGARGALHSGALWTGQ